MGLRVAQESGARISFGQAIVRQFPQWLQVFWIDAMFAIFTERYRASERAPNDAVIGAACITSPCVDGAGVVSQMLVTSFVIGSSHGS